MAVCGRRLRGGEHVEGHLVSQIPSVVGRGVCTGLEQSQIAAVVVQVLVFLSRVERFIGVGLGTGRWGRWPCPPTGPPFQRPCPGSAPPHAVMCRAVYHSCRNLGRERGSQRWTLESLSPPPPGDEDDRQGPWETREAWPLN